MNIIVELLTTIHKTQRTECDKFTHTLVKIIKIKGKPGKL